MLEWWSVLENLEVNSKVVTLASTLDKQQHCVGDSQLINRVMSWRGRRIPAVEKLGVNLQNETKHQIKTKLDLKVTYSE